MMMRPLAFCVLVASVVPAARTQSNPETGSITITVKHETLMPDDQFVFVVSVDSNSPATFNSITAVLAPLGITPNDLSNVAGTPDKLHWTFNLAVPIGRIAPTAGSLATLQQDLVSKKSGLTLQYNSGGSRLSPQTQSAQVCSIRDLIADAQTQAQKLATAAGIVAGPIIAVSETDRGTAPASKLVVIGSSLLSGNFSGSPSGVITTSPVGVQQLVSYFPAVPSICGITVKFRLYR